MTSPTALPSIRIVEVGPRDGLQNVKQTIPTATKIELISRLHAVGLRSIELTSVVSSRAIPQLADCSAVLRAPTVQTLVSDRAVRAPVLIPNVKGLISALEHKVREVAVFVSATEGFSQANIRCTVQQGLDRAREVATKARSHGLAIRGYVSCVIACPFDGPTPANAVLDCVQQLLDMGCYEISLGDTIGVGVPADVNRLVRHLQDAGVPLTKLAGHFHDTYGQAIANVWEAIQCGIRVFDSSVAGLGGCPYAPGAKGNLATEDLVYTLHQAGIDTGVDLARLVDTGVWISQQLSAPNSSRAGAALAAKKTASRQKGSNSEVQTPPSRIQWVKQPSEDDIEMFKSGPMVKIVLNRPKKGNTLTSSMISTLTEFFENVSTDASVTRIALAARGKYFCTGMDLGKHSSPVGQGESASDAQYTRLTRLFDAIDRAPQVTVACVQGPAFGGGVGLAFSCDIRLMAANASITFSEVRLGLAPATISKYVIRELGIAFTRETMLSARTVPAQELLRLGKITKVLEPSTDPQAALDTYLANLRHSAPQASAMAKELVKLSWLNDDGNEKQATGIRNVFDRMMTRDSESSYGLRQFHGGAKDIDWDAYTLSKAKTKPRL